MSANGRPRGSLPGAFEGFPAYGAIHEVIPDGGLRTFTSTFARIADLVIVSTLNDVKFEPFTPEDFEDPALLDRAEEELPETVETDEYDPRHWYKIFDVDHMGLGVVEMDPTAKAARSMRAIWEGHDFGAVEQEARDEVARYTGLQSERPALLMGSVEGTGRRLPHIHREQVRQKLALMPDTVASREAVEMIGAEADIINRALRRRLKQFVAPWDVTPLLPFAVFKQAVTAEQVDIIQQSADAYVKHSPLAIRLGDLVFRHHTSRNKARQKNHRK